MNDSIKFSKNLIEKARISDVSNLLSLIDNYASKGMLLSLTKTQIIESIRDFYLLRDRDNKISGCVALHIYSDQLAEIRSLAVDESMTKKGLGTLLVQKCMDEAKILGISKIFALTKVFYFFQSQGFTKVSKETLPEKVYKDCLLCPRFHSCDEIAVIKTIILF